MSRNPRNPQSNRGGSPAGDAGPDELLRAVREATTGQYEMLGEMGRDERGSLVYLARTVDGGQLVALKLEKEGTEPDGSDHFAIAVVHELDASVPALGSDCNACGAPLRGWGRFCVRCGSDVSGIASGTGPGTSRAELLAAVTAAAQGEYEILGEMDRAGGGGIVYFAREMSSGRLVALRLQKEKDAAVEGESEEYSLAVTHVMRALPSMGAPGQGPAARRLDATGLGQPHLVPPRSREGQGGSTPSAVQWGATQTPPGSAPRVCPQCGTMYESGLRFCPRDGSVLRTPSPGSDLVGQIVAGRFHVLRKLGEGGMGQVYLAEHVKMGRQCAIKVMNSTLMNDADAISRFNREASNASRINHPNVAAIYDFGETTDGLIYLAMEFVEGESLSGLLDRERMLPPARAIKVACQVADALQAAHDLGIVHRDLKPDNIMIARGRDGQDIVKVVDFGIAKATQGPRQNVTQTGLVVGTPQYMSPEQLLGDVIDGRSDIYTLGCILYEMLTGEPSHAGPSGESMVNRRLTEPPPRPRKRRPDLPAALDDAVVKALARSPSERFQSATEFRDTLVALATPTPARARRRWPWSWGADATRSAPAPSSESRVPPPASGHPPESMRRPGVPPRGLPAPRAPAPSGYPAGAGTRPSPQSRILTPRVPTPRSALDMRPQQTPAGAEEGGTLATPPRDVAHPSGSRKLWIGVGTIVVAATVAALAVTNWPEREETTSTAPADPLVIPPQTNEAERADTLVATVPPSDSAQAGRDSQPVVTVPRPDTQRTTVPPAGTIRLVGRLPRGARLEVDGKPVRLTGGRTLTLPPGAYQIVLNAPGYQQASSRLEVASGTTLPWEPELRRRVEPRADDTPPRVDTAAAVASVPSTGQAGLDYGPAVTGSADTAPIARRDTATPATSDIVTSPVRETTSVAARDTATPVRRDTAPATTGVSETNIRRDTAVVTPRDTSRLARGETSTRKPDTAATRVPPKRDTVARVDPTPQIKATIANYVLGINARSLPQLRALYPAMTKEQETSWKALLGDTRNVKDLKADLSVATIDAAREPVTARLTGTITFKDFRNARQTLQYTGQATLRRAGSGWQFATLVEKFTTK